MDVPSRNRRASKKSECVEFTTKLVSTCSWIFSSTDRDLMMVEIVKVVVFTGAGVCPTAGCAPRLESFYARR